MDISSYINVVQRLDPTERSFQLNYEVFGSSNHRAGFFLDQKLSQWVQTLENCLYEIPGVVKVGFDKYQILINVDEASKWKKIERLIVEEILKAVDHGHSETGSE